MSFAQQLRQSVLSKLKTRLENAANVGQTSSTIWFKDDSFYTNFPDTFDIQSISLIKKWCIDNDICWEEDERNCDSEDKNDKLYSLQVTLSWYTK